MTYTIDILINNKGSNTEATKDLLYDLAQHNNCTYEYFQYETEGIGHLIKKNDCIYTVNFDEKNLKNLINFIKMIKPLKKVFIELIYDNESGYNIIYNYKNKHKNLSKDFNPDYQLIHNLLSS